MTLRVIVTGVGRSGTGYMAKLLTRCGFPCGHEEVYGLVADSSWMALPFAATFTGKVVHQVRDPVACARSHFGITFFTNDDRYTWFARTHAPAAFVPSDPLARFVIFWTTWNAAAEKISAFTYRVEDTDTVVVRSVVENYATLSDIEAAIDKTPKNVNTRARVEGISLEDLRKAAGCYEEEFMSSVQRYGYGGTS